MDGAEELDGNMSTTSQTDMQGPINQRNVEIYTDVQVGRIHFTEYVKQIGKFLYALDQG